MKNLLNVEASYGKFYLRYGNRDLWKAGIFELSLSTTML